MSFKIVKIRMENFLGFHWIGACCTKSEKRLPLLFLCFVLILPLSVLSGMPDKINYFHISCSKNNDLFLVLKKNKIDCVRYDHPEDAINNAEEGTAVMILADGYPSKTTVLSPSFFHMASLKKTRLYIEYPSNLPGVILGPPKGTQWERAVISSDAFAPSLEKYRILAVHDCRFIPMKVVNPDIVIARVAGFDRAVFGLPDTTFPILAVIPKADTNYNLMVSSTKLSQFITGRYAPTDAWQSIWKYILTWLQPDNKIADLKWTPTVCPSFSFKEQLPPDFEQQALRRGIGWYFNSGMILSPSMTAKYNQPSNGPEPASANSDLTKAWPFGHRVGDMPDLTSSVGNGSLGVLEGFDAKVFADGTQPVRWWRRGDCNGEIAGSIALSGYAMHKRNYKKTAENIADWLYFKSMISLGDRDNPGHQAYGLFGWSDVPQYLGKGTINCYDVYYGDDQARNMLGMILAGTVLNTDRYDQRLMKGLLANLRLTGPSGFQPDRIDQLNLEHNGWNYYFNLNTVSYSGNFQSYMWACYLWIYQQTGFDLFLKRAKAGIYAMMASYPRQWGITGIQTDRARMLLPLAWLIRIEDTPKHRSWLRMIVTDLDQDERTGAISERIEPETTKYGTGHYKSPGSNENYGTTESSIIQRDGDFCSDLLYTVNFAFVGLHEAAAATGDKFYSDAEEKLAEFLCRTQIRSKTHPELDGGWFRAFDYTRWEYWASNADMGWGAWCIESGWSQSWITIVLALRQLNTSFWDITGNSSIEVHFENLQREMIPGKM